jgi:hypothetical protein
MVIMYLKNRGGQGRTGHSGNGFGRSGFFDLPYKMSKKGPFGRILRAFWIFLYGMSDFFIWNVTEAFWFVAEAFWSQSTFGDGGNGRNYSSPRKQKKDQQL